MPKLYGDAKILTIYIGETDRYKGKPLYKVIIQMVKEKGLSGATVTRGIEGFGPSSSVRSASILRLSMDLPIIVQIVDTEDNINDLIPELEDIVKKGLVTIQDTEVVMYKAYNDN